MDKLPHINDIKNNHVAMTRKHMRELIVRQVSEAVAERKTYVRVKGFKIDATLKKELEEAGLRYSKAAEEITWWTVSKHDMDKVKALAIKILEAEDTMSVDDILLACLGAATHLSRVNGIDQTDFSNRCNVHWQANQAVSDLVISPLN